MKPTLRDPLQQPLVAVLTTSGALACLAIGWWDAPIGPRAVPFRIMVPLGLVLICGVVLAQFYPIHIHQNTKSHVGSALLYLMAILLPPGAAGLCTMIALSVGEVLLRRQRGLYVSDIVTQTGRWTTIVILGSFFGHLPILAGTWYPVALVGTAACLWAGDVLGSPLLLHGITGEPPRTIIRSVVKSVGALEAGQYVIGVLGAIAAEQMLWAIGLLSVPIILVYYTSKRNMELQDSTQLLLEHMADTVDLRDPYTGGHSRRVTEYTSGILKELGIFGPDFALTIMAARVHDIGKIGVPDAVLLKTGKLTDEEWRIMERHPELGAVFLERYPDFGRGTAIVRHHHERWDGEGYPHRLRGYDIPFGARVIAVADSYDAMTSDRPYRKGMSPQQAMAILRDGRGRQWEGSVVDAFCRSIAAQLEQPAPGNLRLVAPISTDLATG